MEKEKGKDTENGGIYKDVMFCLNAYEILT